MLTAESRTKCELHQQGGTHVCWEIIDGQQRLVTLRILLKALVDHHSEFGLPTAPELSVNLNLFRAQSYDQKQLNEVFSGNWLGRRELPVKPSNKTGVLTAYLYFRWLFWLGIDAILSDQAIPFPRISRKQAHQQLSLWQKWELALLEATEKDPATTLKRSIAVNAIELAEATKKKLTVLELRHEPDKDETPDVVFASLNGKRMELDEFDHVRNFVFSNCDPDRRAKTYESLWKPGEEWVKSRRFSSSRAPNLETFLYDYLIAKGEAGPQKGINRARGANQFTAFWWSGRHGFNPHSKLDDFVAEDLVPLMHLWVAAKSGDSVSLPGKGEHRFTEVQERRIKRIDSMSSGPFTPLILGVLADFFANNRDDIWLDLRLNAIEAFAVRHLLIGTDLSPFRARTMQLAAQMFGKSGDDVLEVLGSKMPKDSDVRNAVENFYRRDPSIDAEDFGERLTPTQICAIFDGIEQELSGSLSTRILSEAQSKTSGFSIEHIFPQKGEKWGGDLKAWGVSQDKQNLMARRVHELGNITVLPKDPNIRASNNRFEVRKQKLQQLRRPALNIDSLWMKSDRWTNDEIGNRTSELVDCALRQWPIPTPVES